MIELIMFLFTDPNNYLGKFYMLDKQFKNIEQCQEYLDNNTMENPNSYGMGLIYKPTNRFIGLTMCLPLDTHKNISYNVGVITTK